ncbi:ribosomal protein L10e/L16 [Podospora appendiculata]|uniref:Ribosomal protein L10e/L16 n=1 Tax=Podospora appendiculata TaxID=314037 RepID=A0AAE0X468_9PEZI|nr:ribosomal protein L10e/L16 [Podospora appendiculata]
MMKSNPPSTLLSAFQGLRISSTAATPLRASLASTICRPTLQRAAVVAAAAPSHVRLFSATAVQAGSWLEPNIDRKKKMMKGRPRVPTGGSSKGTTVIWGDYGLRMHDHHRRISAKQLQVAENAIKTRLRGQKYRLFKRVACNVGVYISGNEVRMGKGKGSFDHWATRVAINQVVFEIRGALHEQVIKDAFRLAGHKLPGQWELVKRGEPPVVGITKLVNGLTLEDLKRPRKALPAPVVPSESELPTSATTPSSTAPPS